MGVTIADIAEHLNLSSATVSRSLGHSSRVHPATRAKVATAAMQLGYQGRSRRQKRKGDEPAYHVAVVLQGPGYQSSINAIKLLEGLTTEADGAGLALHIGLAPQQEDDPIALPLVCNGGGPCDLAILMGRHRPEMVGQLNHQCPVVSATLRYPGVAHDVADTGDYWGLHDLTTQVLDLGHRKLAWLSECSRNTGSFDDLRRAGFSQACLERGLDLSDVGWLGAEAFDEDCRLLSRHVRPLLDAGTTCFVCATDRVAFKLFGLMRLWGVEVPSQASITGFDAVQAYVPSHPPRLTSVDPSWIEIGRAAAHLAVRRLTQPSAPQMTLTVSPRFVRGETLGPAPEP